MTFVRLSPGAHSQCRISLLYSTCLALTNGREFTINPASALRILNRNVHPYPEDLRSLSALISATDSGIGSSICCLKSPCGDPDGRFFAGARRAAYRILGNSPALETSTTAARSTPLMQTSTTISREGPDLRRLISQVSEDCTRYAGYSSLAGGVCGYRPTVVRLASPAWGSAFTRS